MDWLQALILGVLQGLTEFLPVSSSGHLEIGKQILNVSLTENTTFTVVVHAATVCSTLVVFRKDISKLFLGLFSNKICVDRASFPIKRNLVPKKNFFKALKGSIDIAWNDETLYIARLIFSALPVILLGLFFEETVDKVFSGPRILILVGGMLLVTAALLAFTYYARRQNKQVNFRDAMIIGLAQAVAVLPGMSRSGATIGTALLLNINKEEAARFSFLMVLVPILGKTGMDLIRGDIISGELQVVPLLVGFFSAFVVGLLACKFMIAIVKRSKLIYFAVYCAIVAAITLFLSI